MSPEHPLPPIVVRTVSDEAAWDRLVGDWARLFESSPQAAAPLRFAWLRHWWRVYGPVYGPGGLRLLTCWRGDRLVGVLPLYEGRMHRLPFGPRRIGFVSTGEAQREESCPDYMNLLAAPGEEQACLTAIAPRLQEMRWDCLELLDVPEGSTLLSLGAVGGLRVEARGSCPVANLEGGFEAYLQRLSGNGRQQARRLLREGEKSGASLEIASGSARRAAFEDLIRLHQERWEAQGKQGCFAAARFTEFHRALIDELEPRGEVILARLSLAGEPIAVLYGFVTARKFDFYQSGVRTGERSGLRSPGNLAHLLLMKELCARGIVRYDFLRGSSSYKERLATDSTALFSLRAWRPTSRSIAYRSARFLARGGAAGAGPHLLPRALPANRRGRQMKRDLLASVLVRSGAARAISSVGRWTGVMGLNYHRIGTAGNTPFSRGLWSASPEAFSQQLHFLKLHTDVIGIGDLRTVIARGRGRYTLLTFDDGYRDNYTVAFPIIKQHGLTATVFVSTGFIDSPRLPWWDEIAWMVRTSPRRQIELPPYFPTPIAYDEPERVGAVRTLLRAFKALPGDATDAYLDAIASATETGRYAQPDVSSLWMTWEMLRDMRDQGMAIGGHTVDHVVLARLPEEGQRSQIAGCGQRLQAELGEPMRWFSYPVGGAQAFNQGTRRCLAECGVEYAFSYYGGVRSFDDWDSYDVRRIAIESDVGEDRFRATVLLPHVFARVG